MSPDPKNGDGAPKDGSAEPNRGMREYEQPKAGSPVAAHSPTVADRKSPAPANPPADEAWVGRIIDDRYRILSLLGQGGMGAVFVAEHLKLHKQVAFKVVRAELAGNGEVAARFAREAMATAQFEHPHVASAIDFGTLPEGGAYFVMQLVRGKSLKDLLEKRPCLDWRKACEIGAQVADALSAAEAAGIVHRDLKPENILIETRDDDSELVRILDFGIARVPRTDAPAPQGAMPTRELTRLGMVIGTPGYMAPEQALGETADHRADLYALGVVLWESITGRALWDGADMTALFSRQLGEPAPALKQAASDKNVPAALDKLVAQLLERTPQQRPQHASYVRDTLRELSRSTGPGTAQYAGAADTLAARAATLRDSAGRWMGRWRAQPLPRRLVQIAAVAAGAIAIAVLYPTTGNRGGGPTQVLKRAAELVSEPKNKIKPPERGIPLEIKDSVETMLHGARRAERRAAAKKVLEYEPAARVEYYVLNIAALERAQGCQEMKKAIKVLAEARDPRALPTLQRFADMPKTGCGFLSLEDCYRCIRPDIREATAAIVEKGQPPR